MSKISSVVAALMLSLFAETAGANSTVELADLVAPADLMATRVCTGISEMEFATHFVRAVRDKWRGESIPVDELRRLLEGFDKVTSDYCEAARGVLRDKKAEISQMFAKLYFVPLNSEWEKFLKDPVVRAWAADDVSFLIQVWPLIALFQVVNELSPESLGPLLRGPGVLRFARIEDPDLRKKYERTTKGSLDLPYRRMINLMLNDNAFALVAPRHYPLSKLAVADAELLRRGESATRIHVFARFEELESTFYSTDTVVAGIVRPALVEQHRTALKTLTELARSGISAAGSAPTYKQPTTVARDTSQQIVGSPQVLLRAAKQVLVSEGFQITSADDTAGVISTAPREIRLTPELADCGTTLGLDYLKDNPTASKVSYGVLVSENKVALRARMSATDLPGNASQSINLTCVSRGVLEDEVLRKIAEVPRVEELKAAALASSKRWKEICSTPIDVSVKSRLPVTSVINLRVLESQQPLYPLNLVTILQKSGTCWKKTGPDKCPVPPIVSFEWEYRSYASWCLGPNAASDCHRLWRFDMSTQSLTQVDALTAFLTVTVSKPEQVEPLIERFKVSLSSSPSGVATSEVNVYRKTWLSDIPPYPGQEQEPRHCPDPDKALARLLVSGLGEAR